MIAAFDFESDVIFRIADALRVPVLILITLTLVWILIELGAFAGELMRRRRRNVRQLDEAVAGALGALATRDTLTAQAHLMRVAWSVAMARTLSAFVADCTRPDGEQRLAKGLADFDFGSVRRLERTRMLVRFGPALGLMGTLIPLSPALSGLARGDVDTLAENLRIAFSVTVIGLLVGAIAFSISLVRDRLYGQDLSDLEFIASHLTAPGALVPRPAAPEMQEVTG